MEKVTEQPQEVEKFFEYPIPKNCYAAWKRLQPAEHYKRLFVTEDETSRQHLLDLILCRLKIKYKESTYYATGVTLSDHAHSVWAEVLEKIGDGRLTMREPKKFYGLLKLIIRNSIVDNLRENGWQDIDRFGDLLLRRFSSSDDGAVADEDQLWEMRDFHDIVLMVEHRDILHQVQLALVKDAPMSDFERKALILSLLVKTGQTDLSDNRDIAQALSDDTGSVVSYDKASALIHQGMLKFKAYLDQRKIDWRSFAAPGKAKK